MNIYVINGCVCRCIQIMWLNITIWVIKTSNILNQILNLNCWCVFISIGNLDNFFSFSDLITNQHLNFYWRPSTHVLCHFYGRICIIFQRFLSHETRNNERWLCGWCKSPPSHAHVAVSFTQLDFHSKWLSTKTFHCESCPWLNRL
jgi:hypothetical protein